MACILLWSSAVRVHDSQAYRKMAVTRGCISRILELREMLLSFQTGFSVCAQWVSPLDLYGKNKTLPPSTNLPEIVGVNTASLGGCLHSSKTRARWAETFQNELNGHVFDMHRDELHQVVLYP